MIESEDILEPELEVDIPAEEDDDLLLFSTVDGVVHAYDTQMNKKWSTSLGDSLVSSHNTFLKDGRIKKSDYYSVIPSVDGSLLLHNAAGMRKTSIKARTLMEKAPFMTLDGELIFTGDKYTRLIGIDSSSGQIILGGEDGHGGTGFTVPSNDGIPVNKISKARRPLWIGRVDYTLKAFDSESGSEKFKVSYSEVKPLLNPSDKKSPAAISASENADIDSTQRALPNGQNTVVLSKYIKPQTSKFEIVLSTPDGDLFIESEEKGMLTKLSLGSPVSAAFRMSRKAIDTGNVFGLQNEEMELQSIPLSRGLTSKSVVVKSHGDGGLYAVEVDSGDDDSNGKSKSKLLLTGPENEQKDDKVDVLDILLEEKGTTTSLKSLSGSSNNVLNRQRLTLNKPLGGNSNSKTSTESSKSSDVSKGCISYPHDFIFQEDFTLSEIGNKPICLLGNHKLIHSANSEASSEMISDVGPMPTFINSLSKFESDYQTKAPDIVVEPKLETEVVPAIGVTESTAGIKDKSVEFMVQNSYYLFLLFVVLFFYSIRKFIRKITKLMKNENRFFYVIDELFQMISGGDDDIDVNASIVIDKSAIGMVGDTSISSSSTSLSRNDPLLVAKDGEGVASIADVSGRKSSIPQFIRRAQNLGLGLTLGYAEVGQIVVSDLVLGRGSEGTVVLLGDLKGRPVAVKKMMTCHQRRANREMSLLTRIDGHSNVVRYFVREVQGDFVYLALQLCAMSLRDFIFDVKKKRHHSIASGDKSNSAIVSSTSNNNSNSGSNSQDNEVIVNDDVRKALLQMVRGVSHLHSQGVVHRDLKPHNILLSFPDLQPNSKDNTTVFNRTGSSDQRTLDYLLKKYQINHQRNSNIFMNERSVALENAISDIDLLWEADGPPSFESISLSGLGGFCLKISDMGLSKQLDLEESSLSLSFSMSHLHATGKASTLNPMEQQRSPHNGDVSAKSDHSSTSTSSESNRIDEEPGVVGTIGWQAPEVILRRIHHYYHSHIDAKCASDGDDLRRRYQEEEERLNRLCDSPMVDVFSLGCVLYFCLSGGKHPFGPWFHRETRILRGRLDLDCLVSVPLAAHLIGLMLRRDPTSRPRMSQVQRHPFFWNSEKRLEFLQALSDRLETESPDSILVTSLENQGQVGLSESTLNSGFASNSVHDAAFNNFSNFTSYDDYNNFSQIDFDAENDNDYEFSSNPVYYRTWDRKIDEDFLADIQKYRKYDQTSVRDLLRIIRNKRHHFNELPETLKARLSPLPHNYINYFENKFPLLLLHCVRFACLHLSEDAILSRYVGHIVDLFKVKPRVVKRPVLVSNSHKVTLSSHTMIHSNVIVSGENTPTFSEGSSSEFSGRDVKESWSSNNHTNTITTTTTTNIIINNNYGICKGDSMEGNAGMFNASGVMEDMELPYHDLDTMEVFSVSLRDLEGSSGNSGKAGSSGNNSNNNLDGSEVSVELESSTDNVESSIASNPSAIDPLHGVVLWNLSALSNARGSGGWLQESDFWVSHGNKGTAGSSGQGKAKGKNHHLLRASADFKYRSRLCSHWEASNGMICPLRKKGKCDFAHGPLELRVKENRRDKWGRDDRINNNNPNSNPNPNKDPLRHSGGEDILGSARATLGLGPGGVAGVGGVIPGMVPGPPPGVPGGYNPNAAMMGPPGGVIPGYYSDPQGMIYDMGSVYDSSLGYEGPSTHAMGMPYDGMTMTYSYNGTNPNANPYLPPTGNSGNNPYATGKAYGGGPPVIGSMGTMGMGSPGGPPGSHARKGKGRMMGDYQPYFDPNGNQPGFKN